MRLNLHAVLTVPCLLLLLATLAEKAPAESWAPVMQEFANSFRELEQRAADGQFDQIPAVCQTLSDSSKMLHEIPTDNQSASRQMLQTHASRVEQIAGLLARSAGQNETESVLWRIHQLRDTCTSCHAGFRNLEDAHSFYPALGNTVVADVNVVTIDNKNRSDYSNVVVFLDGPKLSGSSSLPRANPAVSQKNRRFHPRVLPIVKGTTVDFPNDDNILHNAFSVSKTRRFDLDVYQPGASKSVQFPKAGLVKLYCNIHPEMACSILVLNNSYFALTDRSGRCVISGIPDGNFTLRSWHEFGGETRTPLTLSAGTVTPIQLLVKEKRRSVVHANKYGQPYQKKRLKY